MLVFSRSDVQETLRAQTGAPQRRLNLDPSKFLGFNATHAMIGNPAPVITSVTDNVSPVTGLLTSGTSTNDPHPTVKVSLTSTGAVAGDTVQLNNGVTTGGTLGAYTLLASDIIAGFANVATTALTDGTTYVITALVDQSGLLSAASGSFTVIEDTLAPVPTISAIGGGDTTVSSLPADQTITGTTEAGSTVALTFGGAAPVAATVNGTTWSYTLLAADIAALGQGTGKTISAIATDAAGNASAPFLSAPFGVETAPTLAIAATDATKLEGNTGSTPFTFTVTRSGDLSAASSAAYAVTSTTATAADFVGGVLPTGPVSFDAGQATALITVNVAGDTTVEPDEGFTVTLSGATGATIATAAANGTILNDDTTPPGVPPNVTVVTLLGGDGQPLNNHVTPSADLQGSGPPNATVTLTVGGQVISTQTSDANGKWNFDPSTLATGLTTMTAVVDDGHGGGTTTTIELLKSAAPVAGVAQTEITSHDLGTLLTGGGVLLYGAGTNTIQLADGALSVGTDTTEAFVERLYQGLLGRADDVSGLSAWNVTSQQSLSSVAAGFLGSPEYTAAHPSQTNSDFVDNLYQLMLGRAGDAGGLATWETALDNGATRADVVVGFANSSEAETHWSTTTSQGVFAYDPAAPVVRGAYAAAFGREAEASGITSWDKAIENGMSLHDFGAAIAGSAEFASLHAGQSNADFVASLYQNGLGHTGDPAGAAFWAGQLNSGAMTRGDTVIAFASSSEGTQHLKWAV